MQSIFRASRYAQHGLQLGARRRCHTAMRAPTATFQCRASRTAFRSARQYRLLASSCGVGLVGIMMAGRHNHGTLCEVVESTRIVDSSSEEDSKLELPQGCKRNTVRKKSRKRWFRVLWRCLVLFCKFGPLVIATPFLLIFWRYGGDGTFWRLLLGALDSAGPTFVKLAQWASTRPDLLPESVIRNFSKLQARTRPHSYRQTTEMFAEAFGSDWAEKVRVDIAPAGSGCIGQVYHGWVLGQGPDSQDREVAVKVCHPGARDKVTLDLEIMHLFAQSLESMWSRLSLFGLSEFVCHFEAFIMPQADMRIEASNLDTFNKNFPYASTGRGIPVRFPTVVRPYLNENVLVMSYERGTHLTEFLECPSDEQKNDHDSYNLFRVPSTRTPIELRRESVRTLACRRVGKIVVDAFLQMMFRDQFVHGDMHPGNMLVHFSEDESKLELVVMDAGLAVQLGPRDQKNFVDLMHAVAMKDGPQVGRLMVERSPGDRSAVVNEDVFVQKTAGLVHAARDKGAWLGRYGIGDMLTQMLQLAYNHRVKLETSFVTIVTSIVVVEGVGRQLDPSVDVIEAATPHLVKAAAAYAFGR